MRRGAEHEPGGHVGVVLGLAVGGAEQEVAVEAGPTAGEVEARPDFGGEYQGRVAVRMRARLRCARLINVVELRAASTG